jgi:hypothetical protein
LKKRKAILRKFRNNKLEHAAPHPRIYLYQFSDNFCLRGGNVGWEGSLVQTFVARIYWCILWNIVTSGFCYVLLNTVKLYCVELQKKRQIYISYHRSETVNLLPLLVYILSLFAYNLSLHVCIRSLLVCILSLRPNVPSLLPNILSLLPNILSLLPYSVTHTPHLQFLLPTHHTYSFCYPHTTPFYLLYPYHFPITLFPAIKNTNSQPQLLSLI